MEDSDSAQAGEDSGTTTANQMSVGIQKIYVKDISYEAPGTPQIFTEEWTPKISQDLANSTVQLSENVYEVCLRATITVKLGDKVAYLVEVNQAGIFTLEGYEPSHAEQVLGVYCPGVLFPYIREAVSDLSARGGFPQLVLQHVDFASMFNQYLQQKRVAQAEVGNGAASH